MIDMSTFYYMLMCRIPRGVYVIVYSCDIDNLLMFIYVSFIYINVNGVNELTLIVYIPLLIKNYCMYLDWDVIR